MLGFSIFLNNISPTWSACWVLPIFHFREILQPITSCTSKSWEYQVHHILPVLMTISLIHALSICWQENCLSSSHSWPCSTLMWPHILVRKTFSAYSCFPSDPWVNLPCLTVSIANSLVTNHSNLFHEGSHKFFFPVPNCSVFFLTIETVGLEKPWANPHIEAPSSRVSFFHCIFLTLYVLKTFDHCPDRIRMASFPP